MPASALHRNLVIALAPWPFVGREDEIDELVAELTRSTRRHGVLLRGTAGVGKTRLARAVASALGDVGIETVECQGSSSLAAIPFGAIAPLIGRLRGGARSGAPDTSIDGATFLAELCEALAGATQTALFVDDVAHADPGSLAVIRAAVLLAGLPVILTARSDDTLPDPITRLADEGLIESIEIGPLNRRSSDAILTHVLGGPVDPLSARQLHESSQGNPLFLRELVRGASASGSITSGPHGFATGPVPSARLVELLGARIEHADDDERRVIELLAAAQPVPVVAMGSSRILDRLEAEGVVAIEGDPPRLLARLGHPIYDEVVRASTPTVRWQERLREAASLLRIDAPSDEDALLRAVDLEVRSGTPVPTADLLRAARRATTLRDHEMAISLAEQLIESGACSPGRQLMGSALSALGRADEAEAALREALELAVTDEEVARAAQPLAQHLAIRVGRAKDAVATLDEALERADDPSWQVFLAADRTRWAMLAGEATSFARDVDQTGATRLNTLMVDALVNLMDGRLTRANVAIDEGLSLAVAHRDLVSHALELLTLSRCMSHFFAGDLPGALELARTELASAGARNEEPVGMWAYALSAISLQAGRVNDALDWSDLAVPRLRWRDFTGLAATAVAVRATALAQLGRTGEARGLLATGHVGAGDAWATMQTAQANAWCLFAEGEPDRAAAEVSAAGRTGMDAGQLYLGAFTCYTAVRLGRPKPTIEHLEWAARRGEGPLLPALARHAQHLADEQPTHLAELSDELRDMGLITAAGSALDQAARLHDRRSDPEAARRLRLRATQMLRNAGLGPAGPDRVPTMTSREQEIALLAAARHRSKQIAEDLDISVRTVDNHLASIYRKLDISSRDELFGALEELGLLQP